MMTDQGPMLVWPEPRLLRATESDNIRALCGRLVAADVQAQEGDAGAGVCARRRGAFPAELARGS